MAQGAVSHVTTQSSQLGYSVTHNNTITYISRERSTTYTFSPQIVLFFSLSILLQLELVRLLG